MSKPVLVPDPMILENMIMLVALYGKHELPTIIAGKSRELKEGLTRFEKLFPDRPIGDNLAIMMFDATLQKIGFSQE